MERHSTSKMSSTHCKLASMAGKAASSSLNSLLLMMLMIFSLGSVTVSSVEEHLRILHAPAIKLPSVLSSLITPLNASATAAYIANLESGMGLGNASAFCEQAGLLCNQEIDIVPLLLHALGHYRLPPGMSSHKSMDLKLFFGEAQLRLGNRIQLPKQEKPVPGRAFLPHELVKKLPFRRQELSQLLRLFGFSNTSNMAISMGETLKICESKARDDEMKACAVSLESMLDFVASIIGTTDMQILVGVENKQMQEQLVTIQALKEMGSARRGAIACHNAMFPYQVFYCHYLLGTKIFMAELETSKGELISGMASCHRESKLGILKNELFAKLQVKDGEMICHWNYGDNVVWIPTILTLENH